MPLVYRKEKNLLSEDLSTLYKYSLVIPLKNEVIIAIYKDNKRKIYTLKEEAQPLFKYLSKILLHELYNNKIVTKLLIANIISQYKSLIKYSINVKLNMMHPGIIFIKL